MININIYSWQRIGIPYLNNFYVQIQNRWVVIKLIQ